MDDINFDELDKAVNSAMKPAATMTEPAVTEAAQTPSPDSPRPALVDETAPPAAALPVKRRGQFMDIVHTSAPRPVTPSVSRQASTIKPLSPELVKTDGEAVDSVTTTSPPPASTPKTETNQDFSVEAEPSSGSNLAVTTPFVEGAQVEKRPLGAFAGNESLDDTATEPGVNTETTDTTVDESPAATDELSDKTIPETQTQPELVADDTAEQTMPSQAIETQSINDDYSLPSMPDEGVAQSIPQQYKADNSFSNDEEHAVFDTTQYHQPLLPPAKPSHGRKALMYTLLVFLMLAIGSAAGYAIFVLKLF